jgi:hypothetical protein
MNRLWLSGFVLAGSGFLRFVVLVVAATLTACGTYTPDKDPFQSDAPAQNGNGNTKQGAYETAIVDHVECEIAQGLEQAKKFELSWLEKWGTTVTQTITVEDQTGLAPGISMITPFKNGFFPFAASNGGNVVIAQSFSFSLGGTASANALRTETIQYTFRNEDLLDIYERNPSACKGPRGVMIDGDLKIREFIYDKAQVASSSTLDTLHRFQVPESKGEELISKTSPFNTFTEEITFIAAYGANATPTWHLARFSADTSSNLLVSQRTNTNDLVITLGPIKCPQTKFGTDISISKLLNEVEKGNVRKVVMKGAEIDAEFKDKRKVQTYVPNDPELIRPLYKVRSFEFRPSNEQACPENGLPVLVDTAMNQHQARVQANAIAVSVTGQTH